MGQLSKTEFRDRARGILLGVALGDALGFIAERLSRERIARQFGDVKRFYVIGNRGFVSDDTEQTGLVAQCLAQSPDDLYGFVRRFKTSLLIWFLCLPSGIGKATGRACMRILVGRKNSGTPSAGNGAAMRAALVGLFYFDQHEKRRVCGRALAEVTHCHPQAVEGALFVAELTAQCAAGSANNSLEDAFEKAISIVRDDDLRKALFKALEMAADGSSVESAAAELNGEPCAYILRSLPFSTYCFLSMGSGDALNCLSKTVGGGGDTDTNAAIVGGWLGALKGESVLPSELIACIDDGPFGPSHLRKLADALTEIRFGNAVQVPGYWPFHSLIRNVLLIPIILFHAVLRLLL